MSTEKTRIAKIFLDRLAGSLHFETDRQLAGFLGVPPGTLGAWKSRGSVNWEKVIAKCNDMDLNYLISGIKSGADSDYYPVPYKRQVHGSCGSGELVDGEETDQFLSFRKDWLNRLACPKDMLVVISAVGDSMKPTIMDGDALLVDTSIVWPVDTKIHVFRIENKIFVKEFKQAGPSAWDIVQYNPSGSFTSIASDYSGFALIGRVIWIGRTL